MSKYKFSNGTGNKNVRTVGEMIAELSLLPPELPVKHGFSQSMDLIVFNVDTKPFLGVDEGGQWDESVLEEVDE